MNNVRDPASASSSSGHTNRRFSVCTVFYQISLLQWIATMIGIIIRKSTPVLLFSRTKIFKIVRIAFENHCLEVCPPVTLIPTPSACTIPPKYKMLQWSATMTRISIKNSSPVLLFFRQKILQIPWIVFENECSQVKDIFFEKKC